MVQQEALENKKWEALMKERHVHAWKIFYARFTQLLTKGDGEEFAKFMAESPRDIQNPVWTRWMNTIKTTVVVLENWMPSTSLLLQNDSHPWKICCILGGNKTLAKEFSKILCWYDTIESHQPDLESLAD